MRFLVTGGAGFIGSHLVERLVDLEHEVIVLDDLSTGRIENLENSLSSKKVTFFQESILNAKKLNELTSKSDGVFHLAAALGVKRILERPLESLITNVHGSENVIRAASVNRIKILTDKGYFEISKLKDKNINVWNGEEFSNVKVLKTSDNSNPKIRV